MEGFNTYSTEHGVKGYVVRAQNIVEITFEGLHLQDNQGSSPFSPKKDGHFKDYGVSNRWYSPPRSTHKDWDNRRSHEDNIKPKFNRGYKTTSPLRSQPTNDIVTAKKVLEEGTKPLSSPTYAPQSHFPASYTTPQRGESYPERSQGGKPMVSPISTQPSHYPTSNPITKRKESYPERTKGMKPLFPSLYTQQPHSPTSYPTSPSKENYPDHETQGWNPSFNPSSPKKEHYPPPITTPLMEDYYSDDISPHKYTEIMDRMEAKTKFGNLKPLSPSKMKYTETIDSKEAVKRYNGAFVP